MAQTATMTLVGTFPWMAPEVIQGLKSNESCDVYSFGVLLWEMLTKEVPFKGMEGFQVAWMVVEKRQRPPIPDSAPEPIRNLIQSCWDHDPKKRMDVGSVLKILDQLNQDNSVQRDADKFMMDKDDWEEDYEELMDSLRTEQHSSVKEREQAVSERERKVQQWEDAQREAAKQHGFYGVAQIEEHNYSQKFKFSGVGEGAGESVRAMIESVSGRTLPTSTGSTLTRGSSYGSLTNFTPPTDQHHQHQFWPAAEVTEIDDTPNKFGSNCSISSISSAPGSSTTLKTQKYLVGKKRSVGTPPHSPAIANMDGNFFSPAFQKHMVHYTPGNKRSGNKPYIEGEAEIGSSSRKASVGIVGPAISGMNQSIVIPKEIGDILNQGNESGNKGTPCYKYTRQKSTSNETIQVHDVKTIIRGPAGTEQQGKYNFEVSK